MNKKKQKATGYDKYVDWKLFSIPVVLLFVVLLMPTPYGMKDVGTEYRIGPKAIIQFITQSLYGKDSSDAEQWQLLSAHIMEQNMRMGALNRERYLKRDLKWCLNKNIEADRSNFEKAHAFVKEKVTPEQYLQLMQQAMTPSQGRLEVRKSIRRRQKGGRYRRLAYQGGHWDGGRVCGPLLFDGMHSIARGLFLHRPYPCFHRRHFLHQSSHELLE